MVAKKVKVKKRRKEEDINTEVSSSGEKKGGIQGCIAEGNAVPSRETCSSRFQSNKRALRIAEPLQEDTKHSFHHPKKKKKLSSSKKRAFDVRTNGHLL